jgi:hypothetical protein
LDLWTECQYAHNDSDIWRFSWNWSYESIHYSSCSWNFYVTGNSQVGGNLTVSGNLNVGGVLTSNNLITSTLSLTGSLNNNVNATTGISTFNQIQVNSSVGFTTVTATGGIGIQTSASSVYALVVNAGGDAFIVNSLGGIEVGTNVYTYAPSLAYNVSVDAAQGCWIFSGCWRWSNHSKFFCRF